MTVQTSLWLVSKSRETRGVAGVAVCARSTATSPHDMHAAARHRPARIRAVFVMNGGLILRRWTGLPQAG